MKISKDRNRQPISKESMKDTLIEFLTSNNSFLRRFLALISMSRQGGASSIHKVVYVAAVPLVV